MRYSFIVAACALALLSGCGQSGPQPGQKAFKITGLGFTQGTWQAGDSETLTIRFEGGTGPYDFDVSFSDAVTPSAATAASVAGGSMLQVPFTFESFTRFNYPLGRPVAVTVTGTDANGTVAAPAVGNLVVFGSV
jgi:hypothetical protein